jgi:hypothetical protein
MNILMVVSQSVSRLSVEGIARACIRRNQSYSIFFTGRGVQVFAQVDEAIIDGASETVACEHAWNTYLEKIVCPGVLGSQTDHSRMLGLADRVISL